MRLFAWHTGLRTRIPAYVSAYSYVRMQVWHSSVYPWAYAAFRKRVEFGSHVSYGKGGHRRGVYRSDPRYEKRRWGGGGEGGGGGAVRFRPFIHPCTVYLLNGEGDLALGSGTVNPPTPLCVEYGTLSRSGTSCYF